MGEQNPDQFGQFTRVSHLLRKSELKADEANELTERITNMASTNVLDRIDTISARLESKFDSQNSKFDVNNARLESKFDVNNARLESKIDSQNAKYNTLIIILSILAATGVLGFLANIFNWGA